MRCRLGIRIALLLTAASWAAGRPAAAAAAPPQEPAPGPTRAAATMDESLFFAEIPMVISAVKHLQKASEAPASVEVITARDIERRGYRTLAEALQSLPGMYVNYDRNYAYVGVRGFLRQGDFNARVQVLLNGHPMADTTFDYAPVGEDLGVDMALLDRIEVVYGPGSALYGSNALFATINLVMREPAGSPEAEATIEEGSFRRARGQMRFSGETGGWKSTVSAHVLDVAGDELFFPEYEALGLNGGRTEDTDRERSYGAFARAERGPLSVQGYWIYRGKGIPTGAYGTVFGDEFNRTTDTRWFLDLKYSKSLRDGLDLTLGAAYDEVRYWGRYRYDYGGGLLVNNIDTSHDRFLSQDAQLGWTISKRQRLTLGQGFQRNIDTHIENYDEEPYFSYANLSVDFNEYSAYAQHEIALGRAWHLTTGARYDDYSSFGTAFTPRFAMIFAPRERWRVKAMAGRAFRAPNAYELFYEAIDTSPALVLEPETIASYEVGFEARLGTRFDLRGTLYRNRIRDLITPVDVAPGVIQFTNLDNAVTYGGELVLRAQFLDGKSGYVSYAYMRGEDGSGSELTDYPPHSLKGGVSMPFGPGPWRASADMLFYEERLTLVGTRSPDIFLTNLTVQSPPLRPGLRLSASIYNLFDRDYGLPAREDHPDLELIPQDGITFSLRLHVKI